MAVCLFCYKLVINSDKCEEICRNDKFLERFERLVKRFVGGKGINWKHIWGDGKSEGVLGCCGDCQGVIQGFCEAYHEMKCWELKTEWKLGMLMRIMRMANRVPGRVKQMKKRLEEVQLDDAETVNGLRQEFIKNSSKRLSGSLPRVRIKAAEPVGRNSESHNPGVLAPGKVVISEMPQNNEQTAIASLQKWILSISAIASLLQYSEPMTNKKLAFIDDVDCWVDIEQEYRIRSAFTEHEMEEVTVNQVPSDSETQVENIEGKVEISNYNILVEEQINVKELIEEPPESQNEDTHENAEISVTNKIMNLKVEADEISDLACNNNDMEETPVSQSTNDASAIGNPTTATPSKTAITENTLSQTGYMLRRKRPICYLNAKLDDSDSDCQQSDNRDRDDFADISSTSSEVCSDSDNSEKRKRIRKPISSKSKQQLRIHKKKHAVAEWKCHFCNVVKNSPLDLILHELEHAPLKPLEGEIILDRRQLKVYTCPRCSKHIRGKRQYVDHHLTEHLKIKAEECRPVCQICKLDGLSTSKNKFLQRHNQSYHNTKGMKEKEISRCDQCPAYFVKPDQLSFHVSNYHCKNQCPECGKRFTWVKLFPHHMIKMHPENKLFAKVSFRCEVKSCPAVFCTREAVDKHMNTCIHLKDRDLKTCDQCGKTFVGDKKLKKHWNNVHSEIKHICQQYGFKVFKTQVGLTLHLEYHKKPEEWKFGCLECGRRFADKQKLKQHGRTHTNEKPYVCQFCGDKYAHRHNWRNHMKSKHSDVYEEAKTKKKGNYLARKGIKKGKCITTGAEQSV